MSGFESSHSKEVTSGKPLDQRSPVKIGMPLGVGGQPSVTFCLRTSRRFQNAEGTAESSVGGHWRVPPPEARRRRGGRAPTAPVPPTTGSVNPLRVQTGTVSVLPRGERLFLREARALWWWKEECWTPSCTLRV